MLEINCNTCGRAYKTERDYLTKTSRMRVCSQKNLWFDCSCRSSLMIPEGEYEWYTPTIGMRKKTATIFQTIKEIGQIPPISNQTQKIIKIISDPKSSSRDIENSLKKAPPLALETLKIANNLKMNNGQNISSLTHAVSYIGRGVLSDMVMAASMKAFTFNTSKFSYDLFWKEATAAGHIAEFLVTKIAPHIEKDKAYLTASLCEVGKIVQAICLPDCADKVYTLTQDPKLSLTWIQAESKANCYDHCILGEIAGAMWGFPNYMMQCIMGHHTLAEYVKEECSESVFFLDEEEEDTTTPDTIALHDVTALAQIYKHWVMLQPSRIDDLLFQSYLRKCQISPAQSDTLGEQLTAYLKQQELT